MPEETEIHPAERLLRLLAGGASAEELGEAGAAAPGSGALALRVHRTLAQHRRREAQLTALFDTATDLAASRDLDAVLQAIVRRARLLLGTELAYLTLPDEEAGDTYMRVTDGSVSPLFQTLRLELGEGLGGLVAQTARPYATPDYRTDARFHHTRNIDAGVLDEGLVAILGVPLLLEKQVIGVLFAADRNPRPFSPDEVALLCTLAAHAAIAIDTARALDDTRAALADLAAANAVIRAHSAAMQRAEEAHDRLTDLVLRGGEVPAVAEAVSALLGGGIAVLDPDGQRLAEGAREAGGAGETAEPDVSALVAESRAAGRAVEADGRWVCAVLAGQELLGSLVLTGRPKLEDADRRLFERAGVVTALLLLLRRSVAEAENRVRGELLTDLLDSPQRDPAGLLQRGLRLGIDLRRPHVLLAARVGAAGARGRLASAATRLLFGRGGISAEHGEGVVLVLPAEAEPGSGSSAASLWSASSASSVAAGAAAQLTQLTGAPVTVGAAGPAGGIAELAAAHAEALRTLRALCALGREGDGACATDLGFLGVLLGEGHDVRGFVQETLGPLLAYDDRRGTELVHTLDAYFACGGSLTRAKDALHVHVNTVVQRLDRVEALLGPDWNHPERALELQLALRLHLLTS
ncbi:helix-turn-helix domain-containing protein [Streptacidiphilus neutrinimicus]|uniref:helix-turn-helix domain-containing protein n=1 Tax=Streptacidiphilus neutrinimicus TaxID=105420 RepID=UPI0005A5F1CC|nr:GAF domain-containing protein [Streptacidiphilus neutrinimicus]